jgi:uncharacterized protein
MQWYSWKNDILILQIHLQPGAKKDAYGNLFNNRLRIKIKAPPVAGKANKYLINLLAGEFNTAMTRIKITHGQTAREKTVQIQAPNKLPEWFTSLSDIPAPKNSS